MRLIISKHEKEPVMYLFEKCPYWFFAARWVLIVIGVAYAWSLIR